MIFSILMQSSCQKANTFQSMLGIFLHACRTPEKVIEMLAHMGVSVSTTTIHDSIKSLSMNARCALQQLGRTMCAAIVYDNVEVTLKSTVAVVEKTNETLRHLTSGLFFPLMHGVTREHLKYSKLLWEKSPLNPANANVPLEKKTYFDLLISMPDEPDKESGMTARECFIAWLYLRDLCTYGPEYFRKFLLHIGDPKPIEAIPVVKTDILPAYAMEINNSTTSGNIQAIDSLLEQGGLLHPDNILEEDYDHNFDVSNYIILFHGDLGTGERIRSIQQRRSIEDTEYDRKQMVFFCPGLFHCKMACVDTLHRILIKPEEGRKDNTSLMNDIKILRPRETHVMTTKPGFRRMHQLVNNAGICRRLDCWRVLAQQMNPGHMSLEQFAESQPGLEDLKRMGNKLAVDFTCNEDLSLARLKDDNERDQVFENSTLVLKYLALYEEFAWAMNFGDIGRVEQCLLSWIALFKGTGKHKYATHLEQFLTMVHFELPMDMRHAVRYNWLVNVTGKPGKFRAADWYNELQNLRIKVRFGM